MALKLEISGNRNGAFAATATSATTEKPQAAVLPTASTKHSSFLPAPSAAQPPVPKQDLPLAKDVRMPFPMDKQTDRRKVLEAAYANKRPDWVVKHEARQRKKTNLTFLTPQQRVRNRMMPVK